MANERNEIDFGGRYLIQDQDHMSEIRTVAKAAEGKPLTGTSAEWVKPESAKRGQATKVSAAR